MQRNVSFQNINQEKTKLARMGQAAALLVREQRLWIGGPAPPGWGSGYRDKGSDDGREQVLLMRASFFVLKLRWGYPTPGVFAERVWNVLKTKERAAKSGKEFGIVENMELGNLEVRGWKRLGGCRSWRSGRLM
jgi:hypothetical protein